MILFLWAIYTDWIAAVSTGNIRSVFTDHSLFGFSDLSAVITNTLLKLCLHLADHVICVSEVSRLSHP